MDIKQEWIDYLKSISTETEKCNYTVWMTEDGKMYEIQGEHAKVFEFLTKEKFKQIMKPKGVLTATGIFAVNTGAIRLACYPKEVTMELIKEQDLPNSLQQEKIKRAFCDDNNKKYFQYQFTENLKTEDGFLEKNEENKEGCSIEIEKIFRKFEKFKERPKIEQKNFNP